MIIKHFFICIAFFLFVISPIGIQGSDLGVVGFCSESDGLGKISIGVIDTLRDDLDVQFFNIGSIAFDDINDKVKNVLLRPYKNRQNKIPNVSLLTFIPVWSPNQYYLRMPNSPIKLAYSMFDSTAIPQDWVRVFNSSFDAVIVPDPFLVKVYENSGVKIPIFVLPLGMFLDDFFDKEYDYDSEMPFIFGCTATFIARKNIPLLIQAFKMEFGDREDVMLCLHGRYGENGYALNQEELGNNIVLSQSPLFHKDYLEFMNAFDCYVNISRGEGFSCGPREAMALGIPCILSDNTAHHTLCETGFVREVPSNIEEKALCINDRYNEEIGIQFNCSLEDVRKALRDVYENYERYYELALKAQKWVSKYSWSNLKAKYLNLVKPKEVIYGRGNIITDDYLMTDSLELYNKYRSLENSSLEQEF